MVRRLKIGRLALRTVSLLPLQNATKHGRDASLEALCFVLKEKKIRINVIFDVGAFEGRWATEVSAHFPHASLHLFEPNQKHRAILDKTRFTAHYCLLGRTDGESVTFYQQFGPGDSVFPEPSAIYPTRSLMTTRAIDELVFGPEKLPIPDLLKVDVQGAELEVLHGATRTLESVKVVILECPLVAYNFGAPAIGEYLSFMQEHGFVPFYLVEAHRMNNVLCQVDICFLKNFVLEK